MYDENKKGLSNARSKSTAGSYFAACRSPPGSTAQARALFTLVHQLLQCLLGERSGDRCSMLTAGSCLAACC
eukprot:1161635-Pelagomonas_calceolata.AAC.9